MKKISVMLLALLLLCSMLLCTACDDGSETTTTTTTTTAATTTTRPQQTTRPPMQTDKPLSQKEYEIGTKEALLELVNNMITNNWWMDGITIKLTADIYLNDTTNPDWYLQSDVTEWPLAGATAGQYPFQGTIDGQGHTIYGLYAKAEKTTNQMTMAAFLPQVSGNTTIKNLALRDGYLEGTASQVEYHDENNKVNNKTGYFSGNEMLVSSFVGFSNASTLTIENCYSNLTLKAITNAPTGAWGGPAARVGGILGFCKQGNAQYLLNNVAFYGELLAETGTYLQDQNGTITSGAPSANGSVVHMAGLAVGSQHDAMAIRYTNCVVVPSNVVGNGGNLACVVETTGYTASGNPPMVKNVYATIPLYAGNATTQLSKHEYTYWDDWAQRDQTTCMGNMTATDLQNKALLGIYGENFTWYNGGEFSSTNCWTYDASGNLIQQMFLLPEANA